MNRAHRYLSTRPLWAALAAGLCLLGVFGCNDETPPPQPARFNRPNRVDFVCVNGAQVVERDLCRTSDAKNPPHLHALVTQSGRGEVAVVDLYDGEVIDSRRDIPGYTFVPVGETPRAIVAPPLHPQHTYIANFGSRDVRVLRTRALVATVTEKPDAQRVLLRDTDGTTLLAPIDMVLAPDESALFVAVADAENGGAVLRLPIVRCDASSGPECEDGLIDEAAISKLSVSETQVPAPAAGTPSTYEQLCDFKLREEPQPAQVEVTDAELKGTLARPSALAIDAYCRKGESCGQRLLVADSAQPLIHVIDIDAWASTGSGALSAPIATGAATKDVVVTPRVPRALEGDEATQETQYVYAIDAHDGSVIAIENGQVLNVYALPEGEQAVPGQRADRLRFTDGENGAVALEVVSPAFQLDGPPDQFVRASTPAPIPGVDLLACTDDEFNEQDPARLRGVFLIVARTDGTVHVFDVHDMELRPSNDGRPCRDCARKPPVANDPKTPDVDESMQLPPALGIPALARNHERLATSFVPSPGEQAPTFVPELGRLRYIVENVAFDLRDNGSTASPRAPGLECIKCDDTLVRAFPGDEEDGEGAPTPPDAGARDGGPADGGMGQSSSTAQRCGGKKPDLLCVANDPWSSGEDAWGATYEGALPATARSRGRFVEAGDKDNKTGGLELLSDRNPCKAGALGAEDMEPDYGPAECARPQVPIGDQVVITSRPLDRKILQELLPDGDERFDKERALDNCAELAAELDADPKQHVAFEIRRAYHDRLVLRSAMVRSIGRLERFEDVRPCYESVLGFEVRSYQAFTVLSGKTGFQHHVIATGALGRCQVDPAGDPLRVGRARLGCGFRNHSIQFQLPPEDTDEDLTRLANVALDLAFASPASKVIFRGGDLGFGSATVIVEQLRYSETDQRLYMVDINERGLVPIPLDPFPAALSSGGQFN